MRLPAILATALVATMTAGAGLAAAPLSFETVFGTDGEPTSLHYRASFRSDDGVTHHVEVWRDGDRRLKRATDGVLTSYVYRGREPAEYRMELLDRRRMIHTTVDRTNLYRVGGFVDWFDLAHGLRHPRGTYQLVRTPDFHAAPAPIAACDWYALTQRGSTARICWDTQDRLPLAIVTKAGLVWRVNAVERRAIPAATFAFNDRGYVRTNANQDIAAD